MIINSASSCWSGYPYKKALENLFSHLTFEPLLGQLATEHVQLCPQHSDYLYDELIEDILHLYPHTQFRLHSDVRLKNKRGYCIDLNDFSDETKPYFIELARISKNIQAPEYSLHAGKRTISLEKLKENYLNLQDIFKDIPVSVEVLYPFKNKQWLLDDWKEYEWLLQNEVAFALDLSHAHIVATKFGANDSLLKEMIASPLCHEIHISFNDGHKDSHYLATDEHTENHVKYMNMIEKSLATIFSEGNQILHQKRLQNKKNLV